MRIKGQTCVWTFRMEEIKTSRAWLVAGLHYVDTYLSLRWNPINCKSNPLCRHRDTKNTGMMSIRSSIEVVKRSDFSDLHQTPPSTLRFWGEGKKWICLFSPLVRLICNWFVLFAKFTRSLFTQLWWNDRYRQTISSHHIVKPRVKISIRHLNNMSTVTGTLQNRSASGKSRKDLNKRIGLPHEKQYLMHFVFVGANFLSKTIQVN